MNLNAEQNEVVNTLSGNLCVLSAAGSGKTTTLIERIQNLVSSGVNQSDILAVTFMNKASAELKTKLSSRFLCDVSVGTFHTICRDILEKHGYTKLQEKQPVLYQVKRELEMKSGEKDLNIYEVLAWIAFQKSYGISPTDTPINKTSIYKVNELLRYYKLYEEYKTKNDLYDFDDWLLLALDICQKNPYLHTWKFVSVDEFQDNNVIQAKLVDLWCKDNLMVIGDYRQNLYSFNGSSINLILDFTKTHKDVKLVNLKTNYRSKKNIVDASNRFINPYYDKYDFNESSLSNDASDGTIEKYKFSTKQEEAKKVSSHIRNLINSGISPEDIAVLYRNNSCSDILEAELKAQNIKYTSSSSYTFLDKAEIKGIISILRLVYDTKDDESFEYLITKFRCHPLKYLSNSIISDIKNIAYEKDIPLYDAFLEMKFTKNPYQYRNRDEFVTAIKRLQALSKSNTTDKLINIIKSTFKLKEYIENKYPSSSFEDKVQTIENLKMYANGDLESFFKFVDNFNSNTTGSATKEGFIRLSTIHSYKGLESKYVYLIGLEEGKFPSDKAPILEEANIFYVGVTRPKEYLWVSSIGDSKFFNDYKIN